MQKFSIRNGYLKVNDNLNETNVTLKERIWAQFYKQEYDYFDTFEYAHYTTGIEDMMIEMGISYEFPRNSVIKSKNADKLYDYVVRKGQWFVIYDFIEKYLNIKESNICIMITNEFNRILEEEVAPYRILNGKIVPIVNETELESINQVIISGYDSVSIHMKKALELYSDRHNPDYENSVKESISAIEAMCKIIVEKDGANVTLGNAIKRLKECDIVIHPAMENAFKQLYGYASDSGGIRHGSIEFINVPSEDAKFMLVSCSAFINYLIEKQVKAKNKK